MPGKDFYIFNVYNIKEKRLLNYFQIDSFCNCFGFKMVPVIETGEFKYTIDELIKFSNGKSMLYDTLREGIVVRNIHAKNKISFKVINPEFLLKYNL